MTEDVLPGPDSVQVPLEPPARPIQPALSRLGLAVLMVVVASLGAAIALWTSFAELRINELHRRMTLGLMYEIGVRSTTINEVGLREQLQGIAREHARNAKAMSETAKRLRAAGSGEADTLEIDAQLENAQARFVNAIQWPLRKLGQGNAAWWQGLDKAVESQMVGSGLNRHGAGAAIHGRGSHGEHGHDPDNSYKVMVEQKLLPTWHELMEQIEHKHEAVPKLALVVAMFVTALLFFTLADLRSVHRARAMIYQGVGVLISLAAVGAAIWWDRSSWLPLVAVLVIAGIAIGVGWRLGFFKQHADGETAHLPELEPRTFFGGHAMLRHAPEAREKLLVLLIAWTVLLSSIVGYRYAVASTHATGVSHRAFASEVAYNNRTAERHMLATNIGLMDTLQLFRTRLNCAFASQRVLQLPVGSTAQAIQVAELERDRECEPLKSKNNVARASFIDSDAVQFDSGDSPGAQILNSIILADRKGREGTPAQLFALADGYISLATWWERNASIHLLGLTIFAIALYLLGQGLGMGHGVASTTLSVTGICMAMLAFSLSTWQSFQAYAAPSPVPASCKLDKEEISRINRSPERAIEVAASLYTRAKRAHILAQTPPEYQNAATLYDCATAVRPNFAIAQRERAQAHADIGRSDRDGRYRSFLGREQIPTAAASQKRTLDVLDREGWWAPPSLLNSYGFNSTLLALVAAQPGQLDHAIEALKRGIAAIAPAGQSGGAHAAGKQTTSPDITLLRQMHLNLGLAQLAKGEKDAGIASFVKVVGDLKLADDPELLAATISDLHILQTFCPNLYKAGSSPQRCDEVGAAVDTVKQGLLTGSFGAPIASQARLSEIKTEVRPSRVRWSAMLQGFDPGRDRLTVLWLNQVSGWKVWRVIQPLFKPVDKAMLAKGGAIQGELIFDGNGFGCMPPGPYRAEFYLNGRRITNSDDPGIELKPYKQYRSREMNILFCHPANWTSSSFRENKDGRHLIRAFLNAKGKSAAYVFSFFSPTTGSNGVNADPLGRAWQILKKYSRSVPSDDAFRAAAAKFTGCKVPVPKASLLHKTWVMADGMTHVALVVRDFAPNEEACQVLESIGSFYYRGKAGELASR
ncbi:MAG: hypothetical protein AB7O43_06225 [Hyphomicrobiaceae bacterium]